VLFGSFSPSGRLPVTFYRSVDQLPPFNDYSMKGRTYRYFTGEPLYPFGYGLSYSQFSYSDLVVPAKAEIGNPLNVAVTVRNTGSVAADEVVQLYVTHEGGPDRVPVRALKAFQRVSLQPGASQQVTFTLAERDLSVLATNGERRVEPGPIVLALGGRQPDTAATREGLVPTRKVLLTGAPTRLKP
jgi:beta-glucosidase